MAFNKILLWACFYRLIASQFPPNPEGVTTIQSRIQPGVSISYKEVSNAYQQLGLISVDQFWIIYYLDRDLRDHTRSQVFQRLRTPSSIPGLRCPTLSKQSVLLVFRISQGSCKFPSNNLDPWWARLQLAGSRWVRKRTM
jgi:hypothetical protein